MTAPLSLYLHWPYCLAKCPYCDFNSMVAAQDPDFDAWGAAFEAELARYRDLVGKRPLHTVFFGGGTPSLMAPSLVERILQAADTLFGLKDGAEITLEANPGTAEAARFADFRSAGVNRLSLGVQSFEEEALRFLGRVHSAGQSRAALSMAFETFDRVTFDLITARPDQSLQDVQVELDQALAYAPEHLSIYHLTIEDGTAFQPRAARGEIVLPEEGLASDIYALTQERLSQAGLPSYEVSNHAKPGCESRHNLVYWQGGDYLGLGPGAHGRVRFAGQDTIYATRHHAAPDIWLSRAGGPEVETDCTALTEDERAQERLMMGLRLSEGIALDQALRGVIDEDQRALLLEQGYLVEDPERLQTTAQGRLALNSVIGALLA